MRLRPTRPADFEKARDFLPVTARFAPRLREQLPELWRALPTVLGLGLVTMGARAMRRLSAASRR